MNGQLEEPVRACCNCKHNEWPFGLCDGCGIEEEKFLNFEPADTKISD
jgi:hypothetical protein